jgi:outer membrane protein OmpA-like peptidoglycan-associated protein
MNIKSAISLPLFFALSLLASCTTIPKNAPQEFYDADASIERMEKTKGEQNFPNTSKRANVLFKESLSMLKESSKPQAKFSVYEAIDKAREAKVTADGVSLLHGKILQMDADPREFQESLATWEAGPTANLEIKEPYVSEPTLPAEDSSSLALLRGYDVIATLAYFASGKTDEVRYFHDESIDSLVKILTTNQALEVELTGYADSSGSPSKNRSIAMKRAETLSRELQQRGVNPQQVRIKGEIEISSGNGKEAKNRGQFSRRVQAKITLS